MVSIPLAIASLVLGTVAELHTQGICIDTPGRGMNIFNRNATEKACHSYMLRNTGSEQWDQCPDCVVKSEQALLYYCESQGSHIGGDELNYYCTQNGAGDSMAW